MEAFSKAGHNLLFYGGSEEESCLDNKRVHCESLIPGDFNSLALGQCDFAKACVVKAGDFMLFLVVVFFYPQSFLPLPSPSSPPHFTPVLYYSEEGSSHLWNTPVHTGITKGSQFTSPACVREYLCAFMCVSVPPRVEVFRRESQRDGLIQFDWQA